jgi:hypothetical protein
MKTKYIILTIAILFSIGKTVNAQNDLQDMFAGFEATTREKYSNVSDDVKEGLRQYWLRQSDIRMTMESVKGGVAIINSGGNIGNNSDLNNGKIYAEFDWDNKALMMHLTADEAIVEGSIFGVPFNFEKNQYTNHKQYTDKDGYWYVPYDDPNGEHEYIKFNAKALALSVMNDMLDISNDLKAIELAMAFIGFNSELDLTKVRYDYGPKYLFEEAVRRIYLDPQYLEKGKEITAEFQEKLKEAIKDLLKKDMAETVGFPVFIHWALMYSPNTIKAKFNVNQATLTYRGIPNCTKLTVVSGTEKDKSMIFDQYDRLIFINALKDGTVKYYYDKDVTVTIPAAITLNSIIGGIEEKRVNESSEEAKKAAKEAVEAAKREVERKKEIERLRNEEIAKLEEQLKEAITPQEREEIQQKIKELKELRENETNN